jgi:haloalkane dehalogenase
VNAAHISSEFPFEKQYVEVKGVKMAYVDVGEGEPILLLHGNPTSSYLWRNVIPHLQGQGRCIAPDLIGMGDSDKPDLSYRFTDHAAYLDGFIEALGLENLALVIHDWGSGLGFYYAARHPDNVRAIAFMEAIVRPLSWSGFPVPFRQMFRAMRTPGLGGFLVQNLNMFVNVLIPGAVLRTLTSAEMAHYRAPFPTVASRKPTLQWPREVPINGEPADVTQIVADYTRWLSTDDTPKLLLHADPGAIILADTVAYCESTFPNLTSKPIGAGRHFVQEDHPHVIGEAISEWLAAVDQSA